MKQKIEENLILNKQNHKFFNIASYEDLKNQEFIFYKKNTVIFTNTDSEVDIEKLNQKISFSKKARFASLAVSTSNPDKFTLDPIRSRPATPLS